ncbi:GTPase Era [Eubacterium plexicaudatum ASF492]|uniref:Small GTP-binding protein domain protein n=1 Tax=Eubacterium plexicaudatum ASF492 TaxID=1235802 RepID=N1ZX50_9FIRM|nr:GTPase Era [Eubacterium plexicaudatum ASF492]
MRKINIVIMGKTGSGKSTLVNTLMGKPVAKVGAGGRQTFENTLYTTRHNGSQLNLYDTVGLESNDALNKQTLHKIKKRIEESNWKLAENDINAVWYCINANGAKFEDVESTFINSLVYTYEIPFVIVLTRAHSHKYANALKDQILKGYPVCKVISVLAEEFVAGTDIHIPPYGMNELLHLTIDKYDLIKRMALGHKNDVLNERIAKLEKERAADIARKRKKAKKKIKTAATTAFTLGCIPGISFLSLQGPTIGGYSGINSVFGIRMNEDTVTEIVATCIFSIITLPIFAIPVVSGSLAKSMVEDCCNKYLDAVTEVYRQSSAGELTDARLTAERVKLQLSELLKKKEG